MDRGALRSVAYGLLAGTAAASSVGIWVLMIVDEDRSVGAATVEMVVKFTNLSVVLVALVAAWIAVDRTPGSKRTVAHLTVMVMLVVTAIVNATLLDPALPSGWWGVVDLLQHYVVPLATVTLWVALGPPVDLPRSRLPQLLVVPLAWLVFVFVRGAVTDGYPYDFLDAAETGWPRVAGTVAAILVLMIAIGAGFGAIDRRRSDHGDPGRSDRHL